MQKETAIKLYSLFIFILFITSMDCWIGWGHKPLVFSIVGLCLFTVAIFSRIEWELSPKKIIICLLCYSAYIVISLKGDVKAIYGQVLSYLLPLMAIVCIKAELKEEVLYYITKWFALLMVLGMVLYFLSLIIPLPYIGTITPDIDGIYRYGDYHNIIFYVQQLNPVNGFARFNGPFKEPGHIGMIASFLLFANLYDFKNKYNWVNLIALFVSLSLAGYMLAVIGFFIIRFYQGELQATKLAAYCIFLIGFVEFGQLYNGGDNIINETIISRLEPDEERGIAGNNRTTLFVASMAAATLDNPKTMLFGYDNKTLTFYSQEMRGNGFQLALVRHGLLGIFFSMIAYFFVCIYAKDKRYAWLFMLFIAICYLQRTYPSWFAWIICFLYGISIRDEEYEEEQDFDEEQIEGVEIETENA